VALLFKAINDKAEDWRRALLPEIPDLDFRVWPDAIGNPDDVDMALVWKMPPGGFKPFRNLKAIFSLGAGVDHIFLDPDLPEGAVVTRLVDPWMARAMSESAILAVLRFHRLAPEYARQQAEGVWKHLATPQTLECPVGILGLGTLGQDAARKLVALDFPVLGWSRTAKTVPGVTCFHGEAELGRFLERTRILICLLPLTPATEGIIDAKLLARLPKGAYVVNLARGGHVVEEDLLAALDSGHIAGAALDVFRTEPLPADHAFWRHPKVIITPHSAADTNFATAAAQVAENIRRARDGRPLLNIVDRSQKY
jgi:glyoxylate/hydroxypyruvate reductase A